MSLELRGLLASGKAKLGEQRTRQRPRHGLGNARVTENPAATNRTGDRPPWQALFVLGNEASERYSYYGMKGILALYITNVLMMSRDEATTIIHLFSFVNYFMPLFGAWVSDRFWGRYKTILWISLFYCAGHGVMALSDAVQTIDGKTICLYAGLGLIAFGSGGIKPCVSAFMGDQFGPHQKHLLPKAYAAFYWCINLGSTAAFLTIPLIRKTAGYGWAFGVPGIAMAIATFVFWLGTRHYVMVPPSSKTKSAGFFKVFFEALGHRAGRQPGQGFWDAARKRFTDAEVDAAQSVGPILMVFALAPVFWALFDQTFSTWVLQGEMMKPHYVASARFSPRAFPEPDTLTAHLTTGTNPAAPYVWGLLSEETRAILADATTQPEAKREVLAGDLNRVIQGGTIYSAGDFDTNKLSAEARLQLATAADAESVTRLNRLLLEESFPDAIRPAYRIGPEEMLSANPILVMIFVPIMTLLVYPAIGRFATPLKRMSAGMFLGASSFVIVAWFQQRIDGGEQMSVLWQCLPYVVLTIAEVLFSTTGLEFAFREAAPSMKSIIMGFWTMTVAVGNLLVTGVTKLAGMVVGGGAAGHDVSVSPRIFLFYAGMTFVVAILFSLLATRYRYRDAEAAVGR